MSNSQLFWFGLFWWIVLNLALWIWFTSRPASTVYNSSQDSLSDSSQVEPLRQECLRLQAQLQQQRQQLWAEFQNATFEQLQTLLTSYPTARKQAQENPDLPARNLTALWTPLDNLLHSWEYEPIGTVGEPVSYDPQWHQADTTDIQPRELVYIRFVGYRDRQQETHILIPAKVSRTLPGGAS